MCRIFSKRRDFIVSVLLSANAERVSVSCMRDFFKVMRLSYGTSSFKLKRQHTRIHHYEKSTLLQSFLCMAVISEPIIQF